MQVEEQQAQVNRGYKSSVFAALFDDEDKLRELYAALENVEYDPSLPITITTLRDALYMNQLNDLSFTAGSHLLFIIEHQASLNRNMPLRMLIYIARVYEKLIDRRSLYRETLMKIPRPEFIVLYNGPEEAPEYWEQRLSDAFIELGEERTACLDLTVKVYNINKGRNEALLQRSEHLAGYAEFVAKVRENRASLPLDEAVRGAIRHCVNNRILAKFLEEHGSEVLNMLLEEWNLDEAKEVWWEEGWEQGREEGVEKGREQGREITEAKYQPLLEENRATIENLRRKLEKAGIDPL
jgi:predicted transposase/invertase (TIGR01784 family)